MEKCIVLRIIQSLAIDPTLRRAITEVYIIYPDGDMVFCGDIELRRILIDGKNLSDNTCSRVVILNHFIEKERYSVKGYDKVIEKDKEITEYLLEIPVKTGIRPC